MAVPSAKDSTGLETIRFHTEEQIVFAETDNMPLEDLAQRDADLERIFRPARGLRVEQTGTASDSVVVEPGRYLSGLTLVAFAGTTVGPITTPSAATIRIDLVWFNLESGAVVVTAGTPGAIGGGFASLTRPDLPANTGAIPLAFLYVGESGAATIAFSRATALNVAGHIEDVRQAMGLAPTANRWEETVGNLATDVSGGSLGTRPRHARSDHRHPLNVDATVPTSLTAGATAAVGTAGTYARRDHAHGVPVATLATVLVADSAGGAVGASGLLVRADHSHPLNLGIGVGQPSTELVGTAGVSDRYARADHVHQNPFATEFYTVSWGTSTHGHGADIFALLINGVMRHCDGSLVTLRSNVRCIGFGMVGRGDEVESGERRYARLTADFIFQLNFAGIISDSFFFATFIARQNGFQNPQNAIGAI